MAAEWPWSWTRAPKWYSNMRQQLTGGLTMIFSAEEVHYLQLSADLLSLSSPLLQRKRCYFCTFGGGLAAWGAIMAAVAESHDLTRWQGNYYKHYSQCSSHSESITRAFFCFFSQEEEERCKKMQKMLMRELFLLLLVRELYIKKWKIWRKQRHWFP